MGEYPDCFRKRPPASFKPSDNGAEVCSGTYLPLFRRGSLGKGVREVAYEEASGNGSSGADGKLDHGLVRRAWKWAGMEGNGLSNPKVFVGHGKMRWFPSKQSEVCAPLLLCVASQGMYLALSHLGNTPLLALKHRNSHFRRLASSSVPTTLNVRNQHLKFVQARTS